MKKADRRKPSKRVATSSNGSAAAHTVKRREALRILTRMSVRPSCGGRCPRLGKPSLHCPMGGSGSPVRCSHSLAGAAVQRSAAVRREVNELALTSKLQSPGRLIPPGTAPGPVPTVTHPRLKRDFGRLLSSDRRFSPVQTPPPQASFCHWRPNSALSPKCSLLTSNRGRFPPDLATKSRLRPPNSISCTPRHCTRRLPDRRPSVAPPCVRSFSASRSFTLS